MPTLVPIGQEVTVVTKPEEMVTTDTVTVYRTIHTAGNLSATFVTRELDAVEVPLTQMEYDALSATLQGILAAYLISIDVP